MNERELTQAWISSGTCPTAPAECGEQSWPRCQQETPPDQRRTVTEEELLCQDPPRTCPSPPPAPPLPDITAHSLMKNKSNPAGQHSLFDDVIPVILPSVEESSDNSNQCIFSSFFSVFRFKPEDLLDSDDNE